MEIANAIGCSGGVDGTPLSESKRFGYKQWVPNCLQKLNNAKAFLAFMCWLVFVQSFPVNGLLNVNTSTLQRRFQLTSTNLGLLSAIYDIVGGLTVIPISYYGGRGNKPRYLAIGSMFLVAGTFVMATPHYFAGQYSYRPTNESFDCRTPNQNSLSCSVLDEPVQNYLYVFLLAQGLMGYGGLVLFTLCPVFIDENVDRRHSPLYMGIFYAFASLAAAVGFILGSQLLTVYVDAPVVAPVDISQADPQWVGAWWLGYVINLCLAAPLALCLFGYPPELPDAGKAKLSRVCEAHHSALSSTHDIGDPPRLSHLPKATVSLFRNPAFVCLTVSGIFDSLYKSGVSQFLAQYIENQFNQTSSRAALLSGFALVPGAIGGSIVGGWLPKKFDLRVKGLLTVCLASSAVILLLSVGFLTHCEVSVVDNVTTFNLTNECNAPCGCNTAFYSPVCGSDGLQYFSPCHAGCKEQESTDGLTIYYNCSCTSDGFPRSANGGKCEVACPLLSVFMIVIFLGIFAAFVKLSPWTSATMRVVPVHKRAYALGLQAVFIRLLGVAPGPILFGAIIDYACLVWQERCDGRGSCWLYKNDDLSHSLVMVLVCLKCMSLTFDGLSLFLYKPPKASTDVLEASTDASSATSQVVFDTVDDDVILTDHDSCSIGGSEIASGVAWKSLAED